MTERDADRSEGYARREAEEAAEAERKYSSYLPRGNSLTLLHHLPGRAQALTDVQLTNPTYPRQSPSPTHLQTHMHPAVHHQRRDSDTLRTLGTTMATASSPTIHEALPARRSPSNLGYSIGVAPQARHRRSPTAPEPPTTSGAIAPPGLSGPAAKTWAGGDVNEADYDPRYQDVAPPQADFDQRYQDMAPQQAFQGAPVMRPPPVPVQKVQSAPRSILVNKKSYIRLDMIGKGGTSRVFRVLSTANELFAIKRVSLDKTDPETMSGYQNEISLLKRLNGNKRIIRLVDSELKGGPAGSKGHLLLVMECGEIGTSSASYDVGSELTDVFRSCKISTRAAERAVRPSVGVLLLEAGEWSGHSLMRKDD